MSKDLFKAVLSREFYTESKDLLNDNLFTGKVSDLFSVVKWAYGENGKVEDLDTKALKFLYNSRFPAESQANKNVAYAFIDEIEALPEFNLPVCRLALRQALINQKSDEAATLLLQQQETKKNRLDEIKALLSDIERLEGGNAEADENIVDMDIDSLLQRTNQNSKWKFNLPSLSALVDGIGAGTFTLIAGRVESGKSLVSISLCFSPNGFASQGARVLYLCNEEDGAFTGIRTVSSCTGLTKEEIYKDKEKAAKLFSEIRANVIPVDAPRMTMAGLEKLIKKYKPDIVVVDQLDNVQVGGDYAREDLRLGQLYRSARELSKVYKLAFIAVSQTSAESDGKLYYGFDALANSKTEKPAALDLILLIGAEAPNERGEYSVTRAINVAKNKITGKHGPAMGVIQPFISRLVP